MSVLLNSYKWHEDSKLTNRYKTEIDTLKNGFGGRFEFIEQIDFKNSGDQVVVIGKLEYGKDKFHHILIQFPFKYPYEAPSIFPILLQVHNNKNIVPNYFHKGNQFGDGKMCLMPRKSWNENLNIGFILKKAQKWLVRATSTGGFPKNEIVEELPMHMAHNGQVLIPKNILPEEKIQNGSFHLTQFKKDNFIYSKNVTQDDVFHLNFGDEKFNWYRGPKKTKFSDFLKNPGAQEILKAFKILGIEGLLITTGVHSIGIFMPDDTIKWHFLRITIHVNSGNPQMVDVKYFISKIIEEELYARINDIFSNKDLKLKKITILGLGALGSEVAISLAKNGVGHIDIFDNDLFEIGNSVRHAANLFYIGEKKTEVLKQLIKQINPNIIVNQYHGNILQDAGNLEQSLSTSDACLILAGENDVDYMINDIYTPRYTIPFIFSGVSIGAFSGGIEIVTGESACLRCLDLKGLNKLPLPAGNFDLSELGPEYGNCSGPALPGSEIDIKSVATQVSRVVLQLLLETKVKNYPQNKGTYYRWHGPFGSVSKDPFTWEIKKIDKDLNCHICNG